MVIGLCDGEELMSEKMRDKERQRGPEQAEGAQQRPRLQRVQRFYDCANGLLIREALRVDYLGDVYEVPRR